MQLSKPTILGKDQQIKPLKQKNPDRYLTILLVFVSHNI